MKYYLAKIAYEAYYRQCNGLHLSTNVPMSQFDELWPDAKDAWAVAATAVASKVESDVAAYKKVMGVW
jgi:hypothetical protein